MVKMAFQSEPLKYSLAQFESIYCNETFGGCCCCCQTHFYNTNNHDVDDEVDVDDDADDDDGQENLIKYVALYDR